MLQCKICITFVVAARCAIVAISMNFYNQIKYFNYCHVATLSFYLGQIESIFKIDT